MAFQVFKKDDIIFKQGDAADCMYDIVSGKVGIYVNYGTENEKLLTELEAGKFFGEMGIMDSAPRSATAVALEDDTKLEIITADSFSEYVGSNPDKMLVIMKQMSSRIRGLTADYLDACKTVAEMQEAEEKGSEKPKGLIAKIKKYMLEYSEASQIAMTMGYDFNDCYGMYYRMW